MKTRASTVLFLLGASAQAAVTINSVQTTATQALVQVTAPTSPACTLQVSEAAGLSPLVYDTDPAIFTGADTEAAHLVNSWVSSSNTVRVLRIGLRTSVLALDGFRHSKALAADTNHYIAVTCGGVTANATFHTGVPSGVAPETPPTDATAWGQVAYPEWTDFSQPVIEPRTGMKVYTADPSAWSWSQTVPASAGFYLGGSGWTSIANITSYGTAVATTSNTNPASVIFYKGAYASQDGSLDIGGYNPFSNLNDLGLDIYGSGTDASPTNRTIQIGLSLDSGQTIYSTATVQLALPQTLTTGCPGSAANCNAGTVPCVAGTVSGSNGGCESGAVAYPKAYFAGWGRSFPRDTWTRCGSVTASAGVVTLTKDCFGTAIETANSGSNSDYSYFSSDWPTGTKMYIAGAPATAACGAQNMCTLASRPTDSLHLTLVENLNTAEVFYASANVVFVIKKTNATGSVSLSVQFHVAASVPQNIWTGGCAPTTVTTGDVPPITGYPCIFPSVRQKPGGLYFIGVSKPVIRFISPFNNRFFGLNCTNSNTNDCPSGGSNGGIGPQLPVFDQTDPTKMYVGINSQNGQTGHFLMQYSGTWLAYNQPYASTSFLPNSSSEITYTNLTPTTGSLDLRTQILAHTTYDETSWPALTGPIFNVGKSGPYSLYYQLSNPGVQNSPCWVFAVVSSTGTFYKAWNTSHDAVDPMLHFAGCHAVVPVAGSTATTGPLIVIANNNNVSSSSGVPYAGPWLTTPTAVYRGGVASADTCLSWPIGTVCDSQTLPDTTCPGGLPAFMTANGATGNQCVKMDLPQPCSATPSAAEITSSPCPYATSTKSSAGPLVAGDFIKDWTMPCCSGVQGGDTEGFMYTGVATSTTTSAITGGWFQRNANVGYCVNGKDTESGGTTTTQMQHANGWSGFGVSRFSCQGTVNLIDIVGGNDYVYNQNLVRGHYGNVTDGVGTAKSVGTNIAGQYPVQNNRAWANISLPNDFNLPGSTVFAGSNGGGGGGSQSYMDVKQFSATPDLLRYAFDFRHRNGGNGKEIEAPFQYIGNPTNPTLTSTGGATTQVYTITPNGTPDIKHQSLDIWAGKRYFIDISSAATGNQITDATPWTWCYSYNANECRSGSAANILYISGPIDNRATCEASQVNRNIPCPYAGSPFSAQAIQIRASTPDATGVYQRFLGNLLMTPGAQYVYSSVLPTPDASCLMWAGYLTSGYHTALMMAKLPPFPNDSIARNTFVPITVKGTGGTAIKIKIFYDEYPGGYCTTRKDACYVANAVINEATPFKYASEAISTLSGAWSIQIPALPGHIVYWQVLDGITVVTTGQAAVN